MISLEEALDELMTPEELQDWYDSQFDCPPDFTDIKLEDEYLGE